MEPADLKRVATVRIESVSWAKRASCEELQVVIRTRAGCELCR
jgi:hypothetical protein